MIFNENSDSLLVCNKFFIPTTRANMDQERIAMEGNAELVHTMMSVCRERTLKRSHTSDQLSPTEQKEFQNCIMKYFETPNHIMSAM